MSAMNQIHPMPPRASVSRGLLRRLARARQASERANANRMLIEPGRRTLSYGRDSVLMGQHAIALPNRASQGSGDGLSRMEAVSRSHLSFAPVGRFWAPFLRPKWRARIEVRSRGALRFRVAARSWAVFRAEVERTREWRPAELTPAMV